MRTRQVFLGHFHRAKMSLVAALSRTAATSPIRKREFFCTGQRALLKYRSDKVFVRTHSANFNPRASTPRALNKFHGRLLREASLRKRCCQKNNSQSHSNYLEEKRTWQVQCPVSERPAYAE